MRLVVQRGERLDRVVEIEGVKKRSAVDCNSVAFAVDNLNLLAKDYGNFCLASRYRNLLQTLTVGRYSYGFRTVDADG